jgi:branched-chain amino acid transport system substrate-binding protein
MSQRLSFHGWPAVVDVRCCDQLNRLFTRGRLTLRAAVAAVAVLVAVFHVSVEANAQTVLKIGAVQSMTGPFNDTGKATMDGARLYMLQHGSVVAGRKVEIVVKDDTSMPDAGRRLAQELIVHEKVALLLGGMTPSALSVAHTTPFTAAICIAP